MALASAPAGPAAIVLALTSAGAFVAAITGILSFVSLYIYEHPHHHCPFCILKPEYDYQGYWLYLPLFVATAAGLGAGAMQPFARVPSLAKILPAAFPARFWPPSLPAGFIHLRCAGHLVRAGLQPDPHRTLTCACCS